MLAIIVSHDGAAWLGQTLDALEAQDHRPLDIIAVDNGSSDGSRRLLLDRLGPERVLVAERDLGFPAALSMALDSGVAAASDAGWLLLVHDDVILDPDAVGHLVDHASGDPRLAVVGPKLLRHDDPRLLQQVGMSVDLTGRPEPGLEPDELDQGQRDRARPVLYVSTAGMLVRRDVFERLGRLDRRYRVFRDDLDLCWRAWIAGYDVEVAPAAVARHVRAAANYARAGTTAAVGPRYLAERNTLATLLKCYGSARLALAVPLFVVVGLARLLGFLVTRRFRDAWQTVRAWLWNVLQLRATWRLRAPVQTARVRTDSELRPLFARTAPRLRGYLEALGDVVSGGDFAIPAPPAERTEEEGGPLQQLALTVRRQPVLATATVLVLLVLVSAIPLLGGGALRGGDFAPWPDTSRSFLRAYASGWNDVGGLGSAVPASPAQALLGLVGLAALGNSWLAPRLLLFGCLPVAWLLALRAGVVLTPQRLPRVVGATVYALSPPVLAAVTTGRLGGIAVAVMLPGLVLAGARLTDPASRPVTAWRATAGAAILAALLVAFEPPAALGILLAAVVGLVAVNGLPVSAAARRGASARILAATAGAFLLLLPWSLVLLTHGSPVFGGFTDPRATPAPFLRWLLLAPDLAGFPGAWVGIAFPAAGLLGLLIGFPRRPSTVGVLWATVLLSVLAAWGLGRAGAAALAWPGLVLLLAALAYAGLLATAFATAGEELTVHAFGWRQILSVSTGTVVGLGGVGAAAYLVTDPWGAFTVGTQALPAFIGTDDAVGPYRVLVVSDEDGLVRWDLTGSQGPTMLRYGVPHPDDLIDLVGSSIRDIAAGVSPAAASRLGLANVRYVHVPEGGRSPALEGALAQQADLEPQPLEQGLVYSVRRWLPRAAYVPPGVAASVARRGEVPPDAQPLGLRVAEDDVFEGSVPSDGAILLAEAEHPGWRAEADGAPLEARPHFGLIRFLVPDAAERVTVTFARQGRRTAAVTIQSLFALLAVSLLLRPPGFAEERS
ncbi:MAG TPA: glycosyltransferase [Nitriliruptorales bacterium]|nr:glycosyltransferase [Nitriliruptorales bacterium]